MQQILLTMDHRHRLLVLALVLRCNPRQVFFQLLPPIQDGPIELGDVLIPHLEDRRQVRIIDDPQRIECQPRRIVNEASFVNTGGAEKVIDVVAGKIQVQFPFELKIFRREFQLFQVDVLHIGIEVKGQFGSGKMNAAIQCGDTQVGIVGLQVTGKHAFAKIAVQADVFITVTIIRYIRYVAVEMAVEFFQVEPFAGHLSV